MASEETLQKRQKIGEALRLARKAAGLSLRELEAESGISHSRIAKIEKAQIDPQISTILHLAASLNVAANTLFDDSM